MKKFIVACIVLLFNVQITIAAEKAGLGFEFGTSFYRFSKSNFKSGGGNYFHLIMNGDEDIKYFLHNESGNTTAEVGDSSSGLTINITGIGATINLTESYKFSLMTGSATVIGAADTGSGTNAISATQSTAPVADIGLIWGRNSGNASLSAGMSYRYLSLSNPITFTDSAGKIERVSDMSSLNVNIGIAYSF